MTTSVQDQHLESGTGYVMVLEKLVLRSTLLLYFQLGSWWHFKYVILFCV